MSGTNINIRTDSTTKHEAQKILSDLGLDMTTAFNMFLRQIIIRKGIPFTIEKTPLKKTKTQLFGSLKGKIDVSKDFDEPLDDFKEYM
jgi:DNA-damage-inducible protein J